MQSQIARSGVNQQERRCDAAATEPKSLPLPAVDLELRGYRGERDQAGEDRVQDAPGLPCDHWEECETEVYAEPGAHVPALCEGKIWVDPSYVGGPIDIGHPGESADDDSEVVPRQCAKYGAKSGRFLYDSQQFPHGSPGKQSGGGKQQDSFASSCGSGGAVLSTMFDPTATRVASTANSLVMP